MMFNVGFNLLLSDSAHRAAEIASRPQVLSPVALFQQGKLILQFARRNPFDELGNLSRTERGWCRHHQMHMIATDMAFQNGDFTARTDLPDDFSRSFCRFTAPDLVTLFRDPHKVILDVVDRMCSLAIVRHLFCFPILQGILRSFLAEAIRLKAKVLYLAHGK
jgi:hypothetical protein